MFLPYTKANRQLKRMGAPEASLAEATPHINIIDGHGDFIAFGATSLVELLPNGDIIKSAFQDPARGNCKDDLATEAHIYQRLGEHARLVNIRSWDEEKHTLIMEYRPTGTLEQHMGKTRATISRQEQLRWARQAAEGVKILHASGIPHCDIGPHNFLLDADFNLKIADFSARLSTGRALLSAQACDIEPPIQRGDQVSCRRCTRTCSRLALSCTLFLQAMHRFTVHRTKRSRRPLKLAYFRLHLICLWRML